MSSITQRRSERIDIRATPREAALIREAAEATNKTVTEFVLGSSVDRAEEVLAADPRRHFTLSGVQWEAFTAALDAPPKPVPALVRLFSDPDLA
ncbi:MAG: type II toxin-antitoxin system TacA family antitoxin [Candidatus Dormibacteria bacterium]